MKKYNSKKYCLLFSVMIFCSSSVGRDSPTSWYELLENTDIVVKGKVVSVIGEKRYSIRSRGLSNFSFESVHVSIEVIDKVTFKEDYPELKSKFEFDLAVSKSPVSVGEVAYFFLEKVGDIWSGSDSDVSTWVVHQSFDKLDGVLVLDFPELYMPSGPEYLKEELTLSGGRYRYSDNVKKHYYTERRLLSYFKLGPCKLSAESNVTVFSSIKKFFEERPEIHANLSPLSMEDYKDLGRECVYKKSVKIDDEAVLTILISVDKSTLEVNKSEYIVSYP